MKVNPSPFTQNYGEEYKKNDVSNFQIYSIYRNYLRKEASSETCQERARFLQNRDAICRQVFFFSARQGAEGNSYHYAETLACFLPGRAKDLSVPLYMHFNVNTIDTPSATCSGT